MLRCVLRNSVGDAPDLIQRAKMCPLEDKCTSEMQQRSSRISTDEIVQTNGMHLKMVGHLSVKMCSTLTTLLQAPLLLRVHWLPLWMCSWMHLLNPWATL